MIPSIKKKWLTPEFRLIDRNPLQAKNNAAVRESTGHYVTTTFGYRGFVNQKASKVFAISISGNPAGHKNDLIS